VVSSISPSITTYLLRLALYFLVLLSFLIRVYNLPFESFDMDEADGVAFASRPFLETITLFTKPGENGPLYYLTLKVWMALVGSSEYAVRFLAVMPGVLAVPLMYNLALRILDRREGLIAAVLVTFSSYTLYYSQMNKMYSLVLMTSILSCYTLLKAMEACSDPPEADRTKGRWRLWGLYALFVTVSMYLHIFAALMIPWHLAYYLIKAKDREWPLAPGLTAFAVVTLPYLPLGLLRLNMLTSPGGLDRLYFGPNSPLGMVSTLSREYGTSFDQLPSTLLYSFFVGMTALGLVSLLLPKRRSKLSLFLAFGLVVPILLTYLMVILGAPLFSSRYLIITLPVFFILWAGAIALLREHLGVLAYSLIGFIVVLNGARWVQTNVHGQHFREDWRGGSLYLKERIAAEDLLILPRPNIANAFRYYAGDHPAIFSADAALANSSDGQLGHAFQEAVSGRKEIWVMRAYYQEGDLAHIRPWLEANTYVLDHVNFPGIFVTHYSVGESVNKAALKPEVETSVSFGDKLLLVGYDRPQPPPVASGPWSIKLYWSALQPMERDYATVVAAIDPQGQIIAKSVGPINNNRYPTSKWDAGWTIPEEKELLLPKQAIDSDYTILVGVQELNGELRLTPNSELWNQDLARIGSLHK